MIDEHNITLPEGLRLERDEQGLFLTDGELTLRGDLRTMLPRLKQNNLQREMLVKAAKIKAALGRNPDQIPWAIDATAGMGEDSILLAAAGFRVTLYEKDPVIALLLADALERAKNDPELAETAGRMELHAADSVEAMNRLRSAGGARPDVVLLDPMFPERQKSALVKKKFQLLQQLERPCSDEEDLLAAALAAEPYRLVIKRPLKGPQLAGRRPDYSLPGKAIRYDVIVQP